MTAPLLVAFLLGEVAKVDIRASGSLTSEEVLKSFLQVAYAGAGINVETSDMTLGTATTGSFVIEVSSSAATASQLDNYWCANDPALRNEFKNLAVLNTGLEEVTDVLTCIGETGSGCTESTACGGSGAGPAGPAEPAEPAGEEEGFPAWAIVLICLGGVAALVVLSYAAGCFDMGARSSSAPQQRPPSYPSMFTPI